MGQIKDTLAAFDLAGTVAQLQQIKDRYAGLIKQKYDIAIVRAEAQEELSKANAGLYVAPLTGKNEQERKGEIEARRQTDARCAAAEEAVAKAKETETTIDADLDALKMELRCVELKASVLASFARIFGSGELTNEMT